MAPNKRHHKSCYTSPQPFPQHTGSNTQRLENRKLKKETNTEVKNHQSMGCLQSTQKNKKGPGAPSSTGADIIVRDSPEPPNSHTRAQRGTSVVDPHTLRVLVARERAAPRRQTQRGQQGHESDEETGTPDSPTLGYRMDALGTSRRDGRYYPSAPFEDDDLPEHLPGHRPTSARSTSAVGPDSSREDLGSIPLIFDDLSLAHNPRSTRTSLPRANARESAADVGGCAQGKFQTRITAEPEELTPEEEDLCDDADSDVADNCTGGFVESGRNRPEHSETRRRAVRFLDENRQKRNKAIQSTPTTPSRTYAPPTQASSASTTAPHPSTLERSDSTRAIVSFPMSPTRSRRAFQQKRNGAS